MIMNTLGKKIRSLRQQKNITQKQLAQQLKLAESTIGMYERGERQPNNDLLIQIANYFDVSTDDLLGLKKPSLPILDTGFNEKQIKFHEVFANAVMDDNESLMELMLEAAELDEQQIKALLQFIRMTKAPQ